MGDLLLKRPADSEPLPHKDYTIALLTRAAAENMLPQEKSDEIRAELHRAVAERAAAYTRGRSTTVTRKQAEAFYRSVLCQLDTVLLQMKSDSAAEDALLQIPLPELLEKGQLMTLHLFEEAKEHFREAYRLTKPVQTAFFRNLLPDFADFCTKYDARFRADDTKVKYTYPLLGGTPITENGVLGVHRYYSALRREGEWLALFEPAELRGVMEQYAAGYRTSPDMIAENIAELIFRHWILCALDGQAGSLNVTRETAGTVQQQYRLASASELQQAMQACLQNSPAAQNPALSEYLTAALPELAAAAANRIAAERLPGWLAL